MIFSNKINVHVFCLCLVQLNASSENDIPSPTPLSNTRKTRQKTYKIPIPQRNRLEQYGLRQHINKPRETSSVINLDDEKDINETVCNKNDSSDYTTENYLMNIKVKWDSNIERIQLRRVRIKFQIMCTISFFY